MTSAGPQSGMYVAECLHIDVLLAEGHPLDAALLFAVRSLGGLNCTKQVCMWSKPNSGNLLKF